MNLRDDRVAYWFHGELFEGASYRRLRPTERNFPWNQEASEGVYDSCKIRADMAASFSITPRARDDLRGIWLYTRNVWGETQADKYVSDIHSRFAWLAKQPRIGKYRPDIDDGYYCFPHASHLVFYLIRAEQIDIIGVIHKEMDILNYFEGGV